MTRIKLCLCVIILQGNPIYFQLFYFKKKSNQNNDIKKSQYLPKEILTLIFLAKKTYFFTAFLAS